jgi:hypothetical protein
MLTKIKSLFSNSGPDKNIRPITEKLEINDNLHTRYPLTITIHNANGGYVLSSRRYNKNTDEYDTVLYIVHEEQEVSKTVEKIIFIDNIAR